MKPRWRWAVEAEVCVGCGICADLCRFGALDHPAAAALPAPVPGRCTGCGVCARECPTGAVRLRRDAPVGAPAAC